LDVSLSVDLNSLGASGGHQCHNFGGGSHICKISFCF
jgi:hypothetical protein